LDGSLQRGRLKRRAATADNFQDYMHFVLRLAYALAAVSAFMLVNRSTGTGDAASADAVRCELEPPRDVAALEACRARAPFDVELLLDLGAAYDTAGRSADALALYRRAAEIDPRDASVWLRLAESLQRTGDVDGARRAAATALVLRPNDPIALRLNGR
jgi:tetratricopeptide (TPR) repeat protein